MFFGLSVYALLIGIQVPTFGWIVLPRVGPCVF